MVPYSSTETMKMISCAGCDLPILERFLLNVLDRSWHTNCVKCCECKSNLQEKCFSRDGKLYCRSDFYKRFGTKCAGCTQGILPTDFVRRACGKVFHVKCFTCLVCHKQLTTGEHLYVLEENRFICEKDYISTRHNPGILNDSTNDGDEPDLDENVISPCDDLSPKEELDSDQEDESMLGLETMPTLSSLTPHNSHHALSSKSSPMSASSSLSDSALCPNGGPGMGMAGDPSSPTHASGSGGGNDDGQAGATKRRGPRTTIKAKQLETLKAAFAATPKPTRHIREQLANETGLNMRVIQVWFQNRRSKERRMKQLNSLGARRHFFRNSRRAMRPLRPGITPDGLEDSPEMLHNHTNGFGYFSDSSNPSEFQFNGSGPPHGSYFDFYPNAHNAHHNADGAPPPPPNLVSPFSTGPNGHANASSGGSVPNLLDGPNMHQQGIINLGADAPFMSSDTIVAGQSRNSVSPPNSVELNLSSLTPDTFVRPNSASSGPPTNSYPTMAETQVW